MNIGVCAFGFAGDKKSAYMDVKGRVVLVSVNVCVCVCLGTHIYLHC